jgi:fimbrial chaperone protein
MKIFSTKAALSAVILLAFAMACRAGSIEVSPVRIQLSASTKVAVMTVHNTGTEDSVMQVTMNRWAIGGDGYTYEPTQDLLVTPATFKLAPGARQIVRIGLRESAPAQREVAYRMLVEEVPPPNAASVTGTLLVVRHDVPVFVEPAAALKVALDVEMDCTAGGPQLRVTNIGNVHTQLLGVVLHGSTPEQVLGRWDAFDYLLPEARRSWLITDVAPAAKGQSFRLTTQTDQGSFTANVANKCL